MEVSVEDVLLHAAQIGEQFRHDFQDLVTDHIGNSDDSKGSDDHVINDSRKSIRDFVYELRQLGPSILRILEPPKQILEFGVAVTEIEDQLERIVHTEWPLDVPSGAAEQPDGRYWRVFQYMLRIESIFVRFQLQLRLAGSAKLLPQLDFTPKEDWKKGGTVPS